MNLLTAKLISGHVKSVASCRDTVRHFSGFFGGCRTLVLGENRAVQWAWWGPKKVDQAVDV